jgi:hypothetical protein
MSTAATTARWSAAPLLRSRVAWTAVGTIALAAVLVLVRVMVLGDYYPVDDAYIGLHAAAALWAGDGTALASSTSLVHVALLAALHPVAPLGPAIIGGLGAAAYLIGIDRSAVQAGLRAPWRGVLGLLALGSGLIPLHLLNGLETATTLAVCAWLLALAGPGRAPVAFGVLAGTAAFIRPELGTLAVLLMMHRAWRAVHAGDPRDATRIAVAAGVSAAPWASWAAVTTGSVVPPTVGVKVLWFDEFPAPMSDRAADLAAGALQFAGVLGPLVLGVFALLPRAQGWVVAGFAACFYGAALVWMPSATVQYDGRYQYVLVPALLVGLAWALGDPSWRVRRYGRVVAVAALVFGVATAPTHWGYFVRPHDLTRFEITAIAAWCQDHVPPGTPVLAHDVGYLSTAGVPVVDLVGLTDRRIADRNAELISAPGPAGGEAGRRAAIVATARASGARLLVVRNSWDVQFHITAALRSAGWEVTLEHDWGTYSTWRLGPAGR